MCAKIRCTDTVEIFLETKWGLRDICSLLHPAHPQKKKLEPRKQPLIGPWARFRQIRGFIREGQCTVFRRTVGISAQ